MHNSCHCSTWPLLHTADCTHLYAHADIIDQPQHLRMPVTQHSSRGHGRQLHPQRCQLRLCCCHECGACHSHHLHQLLAHGLAQLQRACSSTNISSTA